MSRVSLSGNPSGTGTFTIASPNSNTDRTLSLPDASGTLNTSGAPNEVPAGSAAAPAIYPAGDTNTGIFFPAADTIAFSEGGTESMRIDASGRLGIGVTSPGKRLEVTSAPSTDASVVGALFNISNPGLTPTQINNTTTGMGVNGIVENFAGDSHYRSFWGFAIDKGAGGLGSGATNTVNPDSRSFAIRQFVSGTTWSTQFLVNDAGRVGIGTTAPSATLSIRPSSDAPNTVHLLGDGNVLYGSLGFDSHTGAGGNFRIASNNATVFLTAGSERARIDSSGFMGIGTSSPVSRLHVNGAFTVEGGTNVLVLFNSGARPDNSTGYRLNEAYGAQWTGSASSRIWHSSFVNSSILVGFAPSGSDFGNGNGYFTGTVSQNYSDIRLKNDLGTIDNALNKVMQLRGFRYTINKLGQDLGFNDDGVEVGLSAQDVQAVLPEAVMLAGVDMAPGENGEVISKSGENYLTLRYDRVVPLLVNAIQELKADLDATKAELAALKGQA
jgi:hypothetical protein